MITEDSQKNCSHENTKRDLCTLTAHELRNATSICVYFKVPSWSHPFWAKTFYISCCNCKRNYIYDTPRKAYNAARKYVEQQRAKYPGHVFMLEAVE